MIRKDFYGLFQDTLFVAIPSQGGSPLHSKILEKVLQKNTDDQKNGAYFTVNGFASFQEGSFTGRTKANVTSFNGNFLDIDLTPASKRIEAEAIFKELMDGGLEPTAVVLTGKGLHVYWLYSEPYGFSEQKLKEYDILQTAIVERYKERGGDMGARDAARVLRLPGGRYYSKDTGEYECDVELLYFSPELRYTPQQIASYFKNTLKIDTPEGEGLARLVGDGYDLARAMNVKRGSMHHESYSLALSLLQKAKDLNSARDMYRAVLTTWEQPLDWGKCWVQFENAKAFIQKEKPQAFISEAIEIIPQPFGSMEPEPIEWLWDGIIAKGKVHILAGAPGLGKSQLTIDIAARLSNGEPLPSYTLGAKGKEPMGVIILSAEDDPKDTILPRLMAAGANCDYVYSIPSTKITKGKNGRPSMSGIALQEDAELILEGISKLPVKVGLIIIDPVSSFMSREQDSNSNTDVRGMLAQLQAVIGNKGIAMLLLNHLNKNTAAKTAHGRSLGSTAWTAVARATMVCAWENKDDARVAFLPDKMNLAKKEGKGFFYNIKSKDIVIKGTVQSVPYIQWDQNAFPTKDADEYMGEAPKSAPKGNVCEAELEMWLHGRGEVQAADAVEYMKERGFTRLMVYRAAREMGVMVRHGIWKGT